MSVQGRSGFMSACPVRRKSSMAVSAPQSKEDWLAAVAKLSGSHPLESLAAQVLMRFDLTQPQVLKSTPIPPPTLAVVRWFVPPGPRAGRSVVLVAAWPTGPGPVSPGDSASFAGRLRSV
jgi:hypothetical protein